MYNRCNTCNNLIYFCNTAWNTRNIPLKHMKHLKHTLATFIFHPSSVRRSAKQGMDRRMCRCACAAAKCAYLVTFGRITCDMWILQATMASLVERIGPTIIESIHRPLDPLPHSSMVVHLWARVRVTRRVPSPLRHRQHPPPISSA
jgi:hypothetical protein